MLFLYILPVSLQSKTDIRKRVTVFIQKTWFVKSKIENSRRVFLRSRISTQMFTLVSELKSQKKRVEFYGNHEDGLYMKAIVFVLSKSVAKVLYASIPSIHTLLFAPLFLIFGKGRNSEAPTFFFLLQLLVSGRIS